MRIIDAHCHYGRESLDGSLARLRISANKTEDMLKEDWNKYNIEKCILFSQPVPQSLKRYLAEGIIYPGYFFYRTIRDKFKHRLVDYSKINLELHGLKDKRIEFVPFINSGNDFLDLENFNGIPGIKFYEPYGPISENLLSYLNENEMNLIIHISNETSKKPKNFLDIVEAYEGINFQIAHCANGSSEIIGALDEFSNLFIDTSACSHWLYKIIFRSNNTSFQEMISNNVDKVLFGSDEPWTKYETQINQITELDVLNKTDKEKIFHKNYSLLWE